MTGAPRQRRTQLPSERLPRSTSSLHSSTSAVPASQAAAASIALPAAAAARHCAPGPAPRGHMLRRRLGRSDPRRCPARLAPGPPRAAAGHRMPRVPLRPSGNGARQTAPLPGSAQKPGASRREGPRIDHCLPTSVRVSPEVWLNAWGLKLLRWVHREARMGQELTRISHHSMGCKSGPWYLEELETNGSHLDSRGRFVLQNPCSEKWHWNS